MLNNLKMKTDNEFKKICEKEAIKCENSLQVKVKDLENKSKALKNVHNVFLNHCKRSVNFCRMIELGKFDWRGHEAERKWFYSKTGCCLSDKFQLFLLLFGFFLQ